MKIPTFLLGLTLSAGLICTQAYAAPASGTFTVRDTMTSVIEHHKAIKSLQENREAIRHELDRAYGGYGPRVDASASGGVSSVNNSSSRLRGEESDWYEGHELGLTVTQPVWDGFATRSRVRSTEATLVSLNHRIYDNATTLGLDGLIAHIDVLRNRRLVALAKDNVDRHQEILDASRVQAELQVNTMAEVSQTEARLARAQSSHIAAVTALENAERTYSRLTGMPVPQLARVEHPAVLFSDADSILKIASENNPKILAFKSDIKVAMSDKELSEAALYPVINVTVPSSPSAQKRRTVLLCA